MKVVRELSWALLFGLVDMLFSGKVRNILFGLNPHSLLAVEREREHFASREYDREQDNFREMQKKRNLLIELYLLWKSPHCWTMSQEERGRAFLDDDGAKTLEKRDLMMMNDGERSAQNKPSENTEFRLNMES